LLKKNSGRTIGEKVALVRRLSNETKQTLKMKLNKFLPYVIAGFTGGLLVLLTTILINVKTERELAVSTLPKAVQVSDYTPKFPFDFKAAAASATPVVVHIVAEESEQLAQNRIKEKNPYNRQFGFGDLFEEFFYGGRGGQFYRQKGSGSGVIYSSDGYIITNNHVVGFADKIEVTLADNRTFKAVKIGTDPSTDLAVIKIEADDLPTIDIANSDRSEVGEWVLAVGNPFDYLTSTVTAGIISAKGRNLNIIEDDKAIEEFIQTDAAVNPGNSGGALVDSEGRLLGINTAIATPTGAYAGYSFAIPSNLVVKVVKEIIENGDIEGATLGVSVIGLKPEFVKDYNLKIDEGIYIDEVATGSSAQFAGLLPGDIIVQVDDTKIDEFEDLVKVLKFARVGDVIQVRVFRDNKYQNIPVKLRKGI
jgi:serine protease Do